MSSSQSRRSVLRSIVATASLLLSGCSLLDEEDNGITLGDITLRNAHPNVHSARVELERNGEIVREETVEVSGNGGVELIESTWPSDTAVYRLWYVVFGPNEDPDIQTRTLSANDAESGNECAVAAITIGSPADSPPTVSVGSPEAIGGDCPE